MVEAGDKNGPVEDVTLRYISLRDYDGNVHYIPNGLITTVTNMSRGYAYAEIDVSVAYTANIDDALHRNCQGAKLGRFCSRAASDVADDADRMCR